MVFSAACPEPRILENGIQTGSGQIESVKLAVTNRQLRDDPERLRVALKSVGIACSHDQPIQFLLNDVAEGRVTQVVTQRCCLSNVSIQPSESAWQGGELSE